VADRATGWLNERRHAMFRELLLHAGVRENLLCPVYIMMPDHVHLVWIGVNDLSDQRAASSFLRTQFESVLAPHEWQHQPHDHVLRDEERERGTFLSTCTYITENPVRAGLVARAADWPYTGSMVPGYPTISPFDGSYWEILWRVHAACVDRGVIGKIPKTPAS
jgi:REP element-mobilizing transposase RayT